VPSSSQQLHTFEARHLPEAIALSQQAGWPYRREDWQMLLSISDGLVAEEDGRVVGCCLVTPYGDDVATINMVIVDENLRGHGIGRTLMTRALTLAGSRECRLVATKEGRPFYEKLGFQQTGTVLQYQAPLPAAPPGARPIEAEPPPGSKAIDWLADAGTEEILRLDRIATGADRVNLISALARNGRIAVLRDGPRVIGYGALRPFGWGWVAGPVVARTSDDAKILLSTLFAHSPAGTFMRVDITDSSCFGPWLTDRGLNHVGGGITMARNPGAETNPPPAFRVFALASLALG